MVKICICGVKRPLVDSASIDEQKKAGNHSCLISPFLTINI